MHDVVHFTFDSKQFADAAGAISKILPGQRCDSNPVIRCSNRIHDLGSNYSAYMQRTTPQQREVLCMGVIIAFGLTKKKPTDGRTHEHLRILRKRTLLIGQATPDEREQARKFCQYIAENWVQQT